MRLFRKSKFIEISAGYYQNDGSYSSVYAKEESLINLDNVDGVFRFNHTQAVFGGDVELFLISFEKPKKFKHIDVLEFGTEEERNKEYERLKKICS